jgi:hypothetical protein
MSGISANANTDWTGLKIADITASKVVIPNIPNRQ